MGIDPAPLPKKGAEPHSPIFRPFLLWPNGWMHQDIPLGIWRKTSVQATFFYIGTPIVTKRLHGSRIKIPLGTEVGLSLRDILLQEDPASRPLKRHSPQFSANVRCGQTAGWTKMSLGMEVGQAQATVCSMGTYHAATSRKKAHPPNFWPMSNVAKRLDGSRCHLVRR